MHTKRRDAAQAFEHDPSVPLGLYKQSEACETSTVASSTANGLALEICGRLAQ